MVTYDYECLKIMFDHVSGNPTLSVAAPLPEYRQLQSQPSPCWNILPPILNRPRDQASPTHGRDGLRADVKQFCHSVDVKVTVARLDLGPLDLGPLDPGQGRPAATGSFGLGKS